MTDLAWGVPQPQGWPWRRLPVALALSLLAHWMIADGWHPASGPTRVAAGAQPLHARLERPAQGLAPPAVEQSVGETGNGIAVAPVEREPPPTRRDRPVPAPAARQDTGAATPDTHVYAARELDRYPVLLTPLRFAAIDGADGMRFWLGIDMTGAVVEVSPDDAGGYGAPGSVAREILLAARFEPAIKNARPVRSRILLELR